MVYLNRFLIAAGMLTALLCMRQAHAQTDGFFDTSFAGTGAIAFVGDNKNANAYTALNKIIVTGNGNMLIAGAGSNPNAAAYWWLGEISAAGEFVTTFGATDGSGRITECQLGIVCFTTADTLVDVGLQADGKVLVLSDFLSRTTANAQSFDTAGVAGGTGQVAKQFTIDNVGGTVNANGGLLPSASGLYVVGIGTYGSTAPAPSFGMVRLGSSLSLDGSFNAMTDGNGVTFAGGQYINVGGSEGATVAVFQSGGRVVLVGLTLPSGIGESSNLLLTRVAANGSLDPTFGTNGSEMLIPPQAVGIFPPSVVVDRADRIVITANTALGPQQAIQVGRLQPDGAPDPTFGASGWAVYNDFPACPRTANAVAIAIDTAGRILAAGSCASEFGIARLRGDTGALDTSFGFAGFSHGSFSPTSNLDSIQSLVVDGSGRPVFGGYTTPVAGSPGQSGIGRITYDLVFTNNFETAPRGCLPPGCN